MFAFKVFSEVGEIYFFSIYNCRKDTYGVFSEPVDLNEVSVLMMHLAFWTCLYAFVIWFPVDDIRLVMQLPDYLEVIEHPMDFGTVRKKLLNGAYASLEQFEVRLSFL